MLSLEAAAAVDSLPPRPFHDDPAIIGFYRDLVEPFGATVDESLLKGGNNVFHQDLADHLAADEQLAGRTADLVIVSYALPDVHPFTAVASHLNMVFGGQAQSFSVCEQGLTAPFTALRIASAFQRSGRARRVISVVLEQTTLPTAHPLLAEHAIIDSGAMLAFGDGGEGGVEAVENFDTADALRSRLGELAAEDTLLVLGPWLPETDLQGVHRVSPGSYCTSVWLEMARHWREWRAAHRSVVLADLDPITGRGSLASFRLGDH